MLICTYRSVDIALSDHPLKAVKQELLIHRLCREIALQPLEEAQIAEYLAIESRGLDLPEGLAGLIYRHSEGNPLFMVAVLEHLRERKLITEEDGRWKTTLPIEEIEVQAPDNLGQIIETQIARLSKEQQQALEVASIAGSTFSVTVTAAAANFSVEEFENVCEGLSRRHQIVRSTDPAEFSDASVSQRYEFVHSLYRDVLYHRQPAGRRAKFHLSIGDRLEALSTREVHEAAPELAEHFEKGGDWLRAIAYLRLVAETAGRRYAPREAAAALQHAVELSWKLPETERADIETEVLAKLAKLYFVSFDMRAVATCEALAARAAHYGLVDVEVAALIDMAYPLSWISSDRCLKVLERALQLSARQNDPLMRARTRASCLVRRIWASGWNARDADECRQAVTEIRRSGDPLTIAWHVIDYNFIQWVSSEYREARRNAVESLAILLDGVPENPHLSSAYWLSQFILPWSLMFLGEWGAMLQEIRVGIAMADRNGDSYRAQTLRIYQAWLHLKAMDFAGVVVICESLLPSLEDRSRTPWRRFCLNLLGSAYTALGNYEVAEQHLRTICVEMKHQTVVHDWYRRMELQAALTELYLANGDLQNAQVEAEKFLQVTQVTAERTWQALAWEANARVGMAKDDFPTARDCIAAGLSAMQGSEVPLANWRVHATAAELYARLGNQDLAEHHRESSRATILQLANSLPADEPLRQTFLSSAMVFNILGDSAEEPDLDAKRA
jgi:tetratricopeptide (TPR) repeat protein